MYQKQFIKTSDFFKQNTKKGVVLKDVIQLIVLYFHLDHLI